MTFGDSAETHSPAHRCLFDTASLGWTALRVEHISIDPRGDVEFAVPNQDGHRTVLTLTGRRYIEGCADSRWRGVVCERGAVGMVPPQMSTSVRWRTLAEEPATEIHLTLPGPTLARVGAELGQHPTALPYGLLSGDPVLDRVARSLLHAAHSSPPALYVESAAEFLAAHLFVREPAPVTGNGEPRIERSLEYLRDNLQRDLSLVEIADSVGLSRHHFLRTFKEVTGYTPFTYLRNLRVDEARRHLERSTQSITEIAYLCGFGSHSALSTTFRRVTGVTPSQYRAQVRS